MDTYRIKVKIGEHEFDAEGPTEIVNRQFEAFKEIIATLPGQKNTSGTSAKQAGEEISLDKICRVEGRVVSLTIKPADETIAAMLILLAQKTFRANDTVTASEIKDGFEQSGYRVGRLDRLMQPLVDEGSVVRIGTRKGTRYRLTNQGLIKAQTAAQDALATIP